MCQQTLNSKRIKSSITKPRPFRSNTGGYPPTAKVEKIELGRKNVCSVAGGLLLVCLERALTLDAIRGMADRKPERVVCLDEGFAGNDPLKANAVQIFKDKGVVFRTV
jgi:adenine-specific DNA-methyltransferase